MGWIWVNETIIYQFKPACSAMFCWRAVLVGCWDTLLQWVHHTCFRNSFGDMTTIPNIPQLFLTNDFASRLPGHFQVRHLHKFDLHLIPSSQKDSLMKQPHKTESEVGKNATCLLIWGFLQKADFTIVTIGFNTKMSWFWMIWDTNGYHYFRKPPYFIRYISGSSWKHK